MAIFFLIGHFFLNLGFLFASNLVSPPQNIVQSGDSIEKELHFGLVFPLFTDLYRNVFLCEVIFLMTIMQSVLIKFLNKYFFTRKRANHI